VDKTRVSLISEIGPGSEYMQVAGVLTSIETIGERRGRRLVAELKDSSGMLELTWFQGIPWIQKMLKPGESYLVYGRTGFFLGRPQMVHPEIEVLRKEKASGKEYLEPVYPTTEKLKSKGLGGRQIGKLTRTLISSLQPSDLPEILPTRIIRSQQLIDRFSAYHQAHFPANPAQHEAALQRLKFEELFLSQLRLIRLRARRHRFSKGVVFDRVGDLFHTFYRDHLPFELTHAQKRVIREIRADTAKGVQMNRLLQGDVGSGKTIVAVLSMLLAVDNRYQACLMAPTEILALQHFENVRRMLADLPLTIELLTGSTKSAARKKILAGSSSGSVQLLIGTHALIEETVGFARLGLVVIDEQHRFGVEQRAKLWQKSTIPPHVLVMTATPIPRTLAMTAYGDLDYSVLDELPPGRQSITTVHRYETRRSEVMGFLRSEIDRGRQVYIIFPLIEESAKLDYENLMKGYENVKAYFPEPMFRISMVHGRQPPAQKETNMRRFVQGETQIMVSTTVIEVGVDVPNATVMVIESAEKFGLSQLHQLRGRVGRGAEKSYCILLTGNNLGADARERIATITATNNGFEIAEKDLALRGPGDIEGTRQSGLLNFRLANIVQDKPLLETARALATELIEEDTELVSADNLRLRNYLDQQKSNVVWSKIS